MKAIIIYWSKSGNTEKVARAVKEGLESSGAEVVVKKPEEAKDIDYYDWDLICLGFPSIRWHPPEPVDILLKAQHGKYRRAGGVKTGSPKIPGKNVLIFCTYSGPHTGIDEAIPAGKYAGQFLEHLGFSVLGEWYILSEFHGSEENSTKGRMGDIRGLPNEQDLRKIRQDAANLWLTISQKSPGAP